MTEAVGAGLGTAGECVSDLEFCVALLAAQQGGVSSGVSRIVHLACTKSRHEGRKAPP